MIKNPVTTKRELIEKEKYDELEDKYKKLLRAHKHQQKKYLKYEKYPEVLYTGKGDDIKPIIYIERKRNGDGPLKGIIYVKSNRIRKDHCDVCGKRRKTTAHHLLAKRVPTINRELAQLRIRVCDECDEKIHPENVDPNGIIASQNKVIQNLQGKLKIYAQKILEPFWGILSIREEQIKDDLSHIKDIKKKERHNHQKKCEGRLEEINYMNTNIKRIVESGLGTRINKTL